MTEQVNLVAIDATDPGAGRKTGTETWDEEIRLIQQLFIMLCINVRFIFQYYCSVQYCTVRDLKAKTESARRRRVRACIIHYSHATLVPYKLYGMIHWAPDMINRCPAERSQNSADSFLIQDVFY